MSSDAFAGLPFPAVGGMPVRADSVAEEYAFLHAYPHAAGGWQIGTQALFLGPQGAEDHLQVIAPDGSETMVRFNVEPFYGSERRGFGSPSARLDGAMQRAMTWAKENEPSHPGILGRQMFDQLPRGIATAVIHEDEAFMLAQADPKVHFHFRSFQLWPVSSVLGGHSQQTGRTCRPVSTYSTQ